MIRISGYSDDIVSLEFDNADTEEIDCHGETVVLTFKNSNDEGIEISAWYDGPCWAFTIMQLPDTESEVPWPISIDSESSYSMIVEIQCTDDYTWSYEKESR